MAIELVKKNYLFGRGRSSWTPILLLLPGVGLYFLIAVGPSLATAVYSFTDATGVRGAPVNWIGVENYDEFLFRGLASRDNLAALQRTLAGPVSPQPFRRPPNPACPLVPGSARQRSQVGSASVAAPPADGTPRRRRKC